MAIKYYCPKCRRRFVEWGAKKSKFKCTNDECAGEELKLMDSTTLEAPEKPKLKRVKRKKVPPVHISEDFDMDEGIIDVPLEDEEFDDAESEEEEIEIEEVEELDEGLEGVEDFGIVEEVGVVDDVEVVGEIGGDIEEIDSDDLSLEEEEEL